VIRPVSTVDRDSPISAATAVSAGGGDASTLKSLPKQSLPKQGGESDSIGIEHQEDGSGFGGHPSTLLRSSDNVETPQGQEGESFEPLASEQEAADIVTTTARDRGTGRSRRDR